MVSHIFKSDVAHFRRLQMRGLAIYYRYLHACDQTMIEAKYCQKPFKKFRKTNYYPFAPLPSLLNALDVNACTTWNKLLHETKFFCVNCSLREPKPEEYLNVAKICSYNNVTISYAAAGLVELQTRRRYDATLEINFTRSIK